MLSGILIFNQKGENLIFRSFRNDCRPRLADVFRIQVISNAQVRSPILTLGSTTFSHVKHENIYLVAVTKSNANAALVFEFLYRLVGLGKGYFGKFDEEAVKNNFVLVYELLDEILDFGYPQNTDTDTLKMYITTEGVKSERSMEDSSKITMQATGALSWRRADIKYRKNEAFVDVIEDVNLLMSATGTVLRADVSGQIVMRAYLSGTPECKFGLNDRLLLDGDSLTGPIGNSAGTKATKAATGSVTLEDCQFHQCVKLGKFDADRTISFIPPDGEFEMMRYRATENVNLPFKVHAIVNELGKTKVEYSIAIKANYGSKLFATNVVVRVPTPLNTAKITERTSQGKAKYEPEHNNIVWKIPRFTGQSEYVLSAEASLTSMTNQKAWSRPPLSLSFSLLMFTSSGLLVRYLKVFEKSNYSSVKWVRYMTRAGSYEIRLQLRQLARQTTRRAIGRRFKRWKLIRSGKIESSTPRDTIGTVLLSCGLILLETTKTKIRSMKMPPMKRKATDSGNAISATPSKRNRGPVKGSEAPSEKQTSRSSVATLSIEDPLASTSDSKRSSTVPRSTMPTSPDMFPRFSAGTVNVQLSEEPNGQYQLHRAVLERSSTWFGRALQKNAETRESSNFRFILRQTPGQVIPMLFKMNGSPQGGRPGTVGTTPSSADVVVPRPQASSQRMPLDRRSSTAASIDLTSSDEARSEVLPEAKAGVKKDVDNNREVQVKQEPQERPLASTSAPEAQQPTTNAPSAPGGSLDTEPALEQQKLFQQFVDAYGGLLSMFYHIAPKMSTSDINCALVQCEKIVKLAMIYGSLPIVRPYLGSVLSEYHVKLYTAIAQDPPRWLLLGIALESGLIFRESMTHCAGSYPSCTWKTQFSALPANVRSIITKKSEWLARLRSQVNEELLLNTLCESDGRPVSMITSPEAWMVVQIFRDWLAKRIQHQRETQTLHYGSLYRMMARGGNAYLPTKDITNLVEGANLSGKLMDEWEGVEGDLKMIKTFAKNAVAQLVKSNVLVSPLELGIPYLTCVEVGEADFPWTN